MDTRLSHRTLCNQTWEIDFFLNTDNVNAVHGNIRGNNNNVFTNVSVHVIDSVQLMSPG